MARYDLSSIHRDIIRMALRGDVPMKRYVPEVMDVCAKLGIPEPPWMEDEDIADRVAVNRASPPDFRFGKP
jgi:hypothetical protein